MFQMKPINIDEARIPFASFKLKSTVVHNDEEFILGDKLELENAPVVLQNKALYSSGIIIPIWIGMSICVILYNKYILTSLYFPYPVFLTTVHLLFATATTHILKANTRLLDDVETIKLSRSQWARSILPIGVLFSGSLILSNYAYLTLSAFTPVAVLVISFTFQLQSPNRRLVWIVLMISSGTALAACGEIHFETVGFLCQCGAVAFEASRLVMIQILLQGMKMNPLVSLHFYAPVCAVLNLLILPVVEGLEPFYALRRVGLVVLLSNACTAFLLNVAAVYLIGAGSGLILTLAGVFKDILIIASSCVSFGNVISPLQIVGYSLSLCGLILFKTAGVK